MSAKKVICIVCLSVKLAKSAEHEPDELSQLSIEALMSSKVVTATRTEQRLMDTAAAAYVITQDDIRRSGATTIPDALRMVPGLQVARVNPSKWAIAARGFNGQFSDKLLVLMDGRSLYSPINSGVYWEVQDRLLDDIERIEVIRGPGASLWGANAVNGVINIITKHAADTKEGNLTFFGGDKNGVGLRKGWQFTDNGHVRVYGKFNQQAGFNLNGNAAKEDWTSGRGGFRVDWANADGKNALMTQGDIYYGVYTENFEKFNGDSLTPVDKTGGNVVAKWNYNPSLASRMSVQFVYDAFQEVHLLENSYNSELFDVDFQHVLALNKAHELTWGLNYRLSSVQLKTENPIVIYSPDTIDTNRFGIFFQDKWQLGNAVEVTLGSKLEHHTNNNFAYEPSLRVLWKASNDQRIWAGISRAARLPSLTDLTLSKDAKNDKSIRRFNSNQQVKPDTIISYEVGYRYWNSDQFSIDLAAYYNESDNSIDRNLLLGNSPSNNTGKSTALGLEMTAAWRPFDWARFQFSSSFMNINTKPPKNLDGGSYNVNNRDPRFQCAFRSAFDISPALELDFWVRYSDSFLRDHTYYKPIGSYVAMDVRLAYKPHKNVELAFVANNLNDPQHTEFFDRNANTPLEVERAFWLQGGLKF